LLVDQLVAPPEEFTKTNPKRLPAGHWISRQRASVAFG
jgi:hypothetical protein